MGGWCIPLFTTQQMIRRLFIAILQQTDYQAQDQYYALFSVVT